MSELSILLFKLHIDFYTVIATHGNNESNLPTEISAKIASLTREYYLNIKEYF